MADSNNNSSSDAMNRLRAMEAALREQHREKEKTDRAVRKQGYGQIHKQKIDEEKTWRRSGDVSTPLNRSAGPVNALRRLGVCTCVHRTGPYKSPPAGASRSKRLSYHDLLFIVPVYILMAILTLLTMQPNQFSSGSHLEASSPGLPEASFPRDAYPPGPLDAPSPGPSDAGPRVNEGIFPTFDVFGTADQRSLQHAYDLPAGDMAPVTKKDLEGVKVAVKAFNIIGSDIISANVNTRSRLCTFDVSRDSNRYLIKVEGIGQEASVNLIKTLDDSPANPNRKTTRSESTRSIETIMKKSSKEACSYLGSIIRDTVSPAPPSQAVK